MQTITHYEVYQAVHGQWGMDSRYSSRERDIALAHGLRLEADLGRPVAVVEEIEDLTSGQFEARLIHRGGPPGDQRPPTGDGDLGSRIFMIALNALTIGAVAVVVIALALSRAGLAPGVFNAALAVSFIVACLLAGLVLFRVYIPMGLILWRSKDPESRKRTILALSLGRVVAPLPSAPPPPPEPPRGTAAMFADDGFQTGSSSHTDEVPDASPAMVEPEALPPEPAVVADRASQLDALRSIATAFADEATAVLARARPKLPASERFALNLYLHGGVQGAALHHDLDEQTARDVTHTILERTGLSAPDVAAYFADLEGASERPRYRRMMDEGRLAIAAMFGHETRAASQSIVDLLIRWSDPAGNQAAEPQQMTFLLTDIVGSTALTSQIGNAGAQRVVRAHNAVARAAAKAFRGREIKHTGDGMLIMFPDSTAGVRAAIDIQQEAFGYTQDNPTAPLVLRVGLHTGEAVVEDGEYYGSGVTLATAACALAEPNEICCTQTIRNKVPSTFRFEEMGARTLKGSAEPVPMHRALWEPKRSASKSVLEYRQIGTTPSPPAGDTK